MSNYHSFLSKNWRDLYAEALHSSRLRAHFNLHKNHEEIIQKTLICILHGSYIPPHFHQRSYQKEQFVVLKGCVKVLFFNKDSSLKEILTLSQGETLEVLPYSIHTVVCLSNFANLLEIKQGPFRKNDCKVFLDWTIGENQPESQIYLKWLEKVEKTNEKFKINK